MPRRSWTSVKAEFLDRDKTVKRLRQAARRLRRSDSRVQQVVLFGSLVKGDYVPGSDADVLVILEVDPRPFMERIPEFHRRFLDVPIDVEVFPYTRDEMAKGQAHPGSFIHSVMTGPTEVLA
jgi:predicted nucleotidyltransferase